MHHSGLCVCNNEMEQFVKERNWVSKDSEVRDYIIMYERILPKIMKTVCSAGILLASESVLRWFF